MEINFRFHFLVNLYTVFTAKNKKNNISAIINLGKVLLNKIKENH